MSTLNGSSTLAQVQAAYDDNASYAEDSSVSKCRAFLTACRILLRQTRSSSSWSLGRASGSRLSGVGTALGALFRSGAKVVAAGLASVLSP